MARPCTICAHEKRVQMDTLLIKDQASLREVAARFGVPLSTLHRHQQRGHILEQIAEAKEAADVALAVDVMGELSQCIERVRLLSDACDRWLRDPEHPERYEVGPRSEDVKVSYEELIGDKVVRKKAPLSELLARLEGRYTITAVETKHSDPRELLLKAFDRMQGRLELVAKIQGQISDAPQINVTVSPQWVQIRTTIIQALASHPEARQTVADALAGLEQPC